MLLGNQDPVAIVLGTDYKMKGCGSKRRLVEVRNEMQYIPMLDTLQRLLNCNAIQQQVSIFLINV